MANDPATVAAFANPKVGDCFTEMYAAHLVVSDVSPTGVIVTHWGSGEYPDDFRKEVWETADTFREHFAYGGIPGYSVMFTRNNPEVAQVWEGGEK